MNEAMKLWLEKIDTAELNPNKWGGKKERTEKRMIFVVLDLN